MRTSDARRAMTAAISTAVELGLAVDDAVVLHDSNKLTLRLLPADAVARVAPADEQVAQFEIEVARRLAAAGCPVAAPEPRVGHRVHERDGFAITLWSYHEPLTASEVSPSDYSDALERLHAGMRTIDVAAPHFTDRVAEAQRLVARRDLTPELSETDREVLAGALRTACQTVVERGGEQLLHGEPHRGNLLYSQDGLRFIDFETCCRGPVEFDLAHAPDEVSDHYRALDQELLEACRTLKLAIVTTWRWDRGDQFPNGRQLRIDWLNELRELAR